MQPNEKNVWFRAKKYGWGWGLPCAWQGWVVLVTFVVLMTGGAFLLQPRSGRLGPWIAYCVFLATVVFIICLIKGEKPRWRWEPRLLTSSIISTACSTKRIAKPDCSVVGGRGSRMQSRYRPTPQKLRHVRNRVRRQERPGFALRP